MEIFENGIVEIYLKETNIEGISGGVSERFFGEFSDGIFEKITKIYL